MAIKSKRDMINSRDELILFLYWLFIDYYFDVPWEFMDHESTLVMVDNINWTHYVTYEISAEEDWIYIATFSDPDLENEIEWWLVTFHPRNEDEAEMMEDEDGYVPITNEMIMKQIDYSLEIWNIGKTSMIYEFWK